MVDHPSFSSRRAAEDDLLALQALWQNANLPWDQMESFLGEFVVVPGPDGVLLGAVGVMVEGREALLHSEAVIHSEDADSIRESLWSRIQNLARTQGAHRIWTQEDAPFWGGQGFAPATKELVGKHPASFLDPEAEWTVAPLVDPEKAQAIIRERMAVWETQRLEEAADMRDRVRRWKNILLLTFGVLLAAIVAVVLALTLQHPGAFQKVISRLFH